MQGEAVHRLVYESRADLAQCIPTLQLHSVLKGRQLAAISRAITKGKSLSKEERRQIHDSIRAANQTPHLPEMLAAQNICDAWLAGFHAGDGCIHSHVVARQGRPLHDAWTIFCITITQQKSLTVLQEIRSRYGGEYRASMGCPLFL